MSVRLIEGDCLEKMKLIPSASVDMIAADLPYGTTQNKWDSVISLECLWAQYTRIIKPKGAVVLTAAQPFASALVMSNPRWFKYEWIWNKVGPTGFLNSKRQPLGVHEQVLVFARSTTTYNPIKWQGKMVSVPLSRGGSKNYGDHGRTAYRSDERYPITIITVSNANGLKKGGKVHPTQKPIGLFEYLIRTYTNPGNLVLDNTMGSGTTGVAAINLRRSFIGIEKDPEYFQIAKKRIMDAMAQSGKESK